MRKKRERGTWTFQPDDDIKKAMTDYLGSSAKTKANRGERTKILNEALRRKIHLAALKIAEQDEAKLKEQIKQLRELADEEGRPNSSSARADAQKLIEDAEGRVPPRE